MSTYGTDTPDEKTLADARLALVDTLPLTDELSPDQEVVVRQWLRDEADDDSQHDFVESADPDDEDAHLGLECAECGDTQSGLNHAHDPQSSALIDWEPVLFPED